MKNARSNNEEMNERYYDALVELHRVLSYTKNISMGDFMKAKKISNTMPYVLQKGGIIKREGSLKTPTWTWVSIPPTKHMAVKTGEKMKERSRVFQKSRREIASLKEEKFKAVVPAFIPVANVIKPTNPIETVTDKRLSNGGKRVGAGRKTKEIEANSMKSKTISVSLFFGMFSFTINI